MLNNKNTFVLVIIYLLLHLQCKNVNMIQNIKISFNILLVVILSIAISNVIPELPVLEEIVEVEEIEELENHIESCIYQSDAQSTGAGGDGAISLPLNHLPKRVEFKKGLEVKSKHLSIGEHPLYSIPFFIRYCSLIVYS